MDIEEILDILEEGKPLTEDHKRALEDDSDLREMVGEVLLGAHALRISEEKNAEKVKPSAGVHEVKGAHRANLLIRPLWLKALLGSAAAVALLAIFYPFGKREQAVLRVGEEGIMASVSQSGKGNHLISTQADATTHEQLITSKDLEAYCSKTDTIQLQVEPGLQCKVVLPDGSVVFLHPGSQLVYPRELDGYERRVRLEGEAYFKVKKDKEHPFVVVAKNSETLVTGTEFNVNATDDKQVSVILVNGSVQFANTTNQQKVLLQPGQQAVLYHDNMSVAEADTMKYVAWRDGYLFFDNASLREILHQISSSYNVPYVCDDARLLDIRMHFVMRRDKDIHYAIDMLNKMQKMKVSLVNGKLHIDHCI